MNLKVYGKVLFVVSLFLVFGGLSIEFLNTFKRDRQMTIKLDQKLDNNYIKITNEMKNLHQSMMEMQNLFDLYYENVGENKNYYENQFLTIKNKKLEIENEVQKAKNECQNAVNEDRQQKCKSLEKNIQVAHETYVKLEQNYNQYIKGHEEWLEKNKTVAMY